MESRLASNSQFFCLSIGSTGITVMLHHTQFDDILKEVLSTFHSLLLRKIFKFLLIPTIFAFYCLVPFFDTGSMYPRLASNL
jgi:hypothetical protein